ncbi:MAG TPA: hypothetical protein VFJ27_07425 [Terriglobia bacterium]|nr:hypothetical protein [Terriglobia bacterium]
MNLNSANVGGAVPAATLAVASATTIAARSAPPTFSSALALRRTMKHLLGGHAKKAQMLLAGVFLQALWIFPSDALAQRTLQGRVVNGTTNRPVAQQKVELLTLGEGMNKNADAVSAADGSFRFTITESASSPHWLLRAIHEGVNYNLSVTPDQDLSQPVTVTIYETTQSLTGVEVSLPLMLAQASGNLLYVQQQYLLDNSSTPKKTLARADGTFSFDTPARELISELSVSVVGLAGIPLPQEPTPRPEGGYRISYPMKPGTNEIRVSFKVNYPSDQRDFSHRLFYATGPTKVLVLPANLQVSGPSIQPAGSDSRTQAAIYQVTPAAKAPVLQFKVVGNAPVVSDEGEHGPGDGHDHDQPQAKVVRLSNRVIENKIIILTGFGVVFAAAILFAIRQKSASRQTAASKMQTPEARKRRG